MTDTRDRQTDNAKNAVVLLSGGLDSAVACAWAINEGFACHALTFTYGQRHNVEVDFAKTVAAKLHVIDHHVIALDPAIFAGSALTGAEDVPLDRSDDTLSTVIPPTYVPARNTVFLALALACAERISAFDIFIGVNAVDYSGYPDCRNEFIRAFESMANLATRAAVTGRGTFTIHTPLIELTKARIVTLAGQLGVKPEWTWSCYNPTDEGRPCGRCDSCRIRQRAFRQAGVDDPDSTRG